MLDFLSISFFIFIIFHLKISYQNISVKKLITNVFKIEVKVLLTNLQKYLKLIVFLNIEIELKEKDQLEY